MLRHVFFAYAAMGWALQESAETAARLGWALWGFWVLRDHQREGYRLAKALLASEVPPPHLRPRVVFAACAMAWTQGEQEAVEKVAAEALELSRHSGDDLCAAYALWAMGVTAMNRGDAEKAASCLEESCRTLTGWRTKEWPRWPLRKRSCSFRSSRS